MNWRFRSGERFELNANPIGERLVEPFEVARGVNIAPGAYQWWRYRVEVGTAQKRRFYTQVTWWFGGFVAFMPCSSGDQDAHGSAAEPTPDPASSN